jgi:mannose-1-phosphate guanylyltransferase
VQALILAGGEGTRLRPLTSTVPKPVLPLANRPFLSYMVDWLIVHGIDDIVMSCGFLASAVRSVLGEGQGKARIRYVEEDSPLGTAGAVKHAESLLGERFAVLNGDILADFDLGALWQFHTEREALATIALIPVEDPSAYGLVRLDETARIEAFLEKPTPEEIDTDLINAGAYVLEHEVLERIERGRATSFEREVFPGLIESGLYGFRAAGYWLDIGTPERYLDATYDILTGRVKTVVDDQLGGDRLSVASGATVDSKAVLLPPAIVGSRCEIDGVATVGPRAVIGDGCVLAEGSIVEGAVLHGDTKLGREAIVRDSIVGAGVRIGAGSRIDGGAVIGAGAVLEPHTTLTDGERIEPGPMARENAFSS